MRQREDDEWQYALICRVGLLILPPLTLPVDLISTRSSGTPGIMPHIPLGMSSIM